MCGGKKGRGDPNALNRLFFVVGGGGGSLQKVGFVLVHEALLLESKPP